MGDKRKPRPKKTGGLYIRKKNVWNEVKNVYEERELFQASAEVHDEANPDKRIRITGTAFTADEAKRRLEKNRQRYYKKIGLESAGVVVKKRSRSGMTVEEYLENWHANLDTASVSKTMRNKYWSSMRLHVIPEVGHIYLTELTHLQLRHLFYEVLPAKKKIVNGVETDERLLQDNSVLNIYKHLRTALLKAVEDGLISTSPLNGVTAPTYTQPPENIGHILHVVLGMFSAMHEANDPARNHFILALYGLRKGERLGLRYSDLKLKSESPSLSISKQLSRETGKGLYVKERTKTGVSRTVTLIEPFLSALKELEQDRKRQQKLATFQPKPEFADLVFLKDDGKPYDLNTDNAWWRKVNQQYNPHTPTIRGHALRHAAATYLGEKMVDEAVARTILGHESVAMTYYYARVTLKKQRIEADKYEQDLVHQTTSRKRR